MWPRPSCLESLRMMKGHSDDADHRSRGRRHDGGSASSTQRGGDSHRSHRDYDVATRDRNRSCDRDRYDGGRSNDRDYHRQRRNDNHHSGSGSSYRHRPARSRSPTSPSSASHRRRSRYDESSSSSRPSRRSHRRSSSRNPTDTSPTASTKPHGDNIRILRASRSPTPQLPTSRAASSTRNAHNEQQQRSQYFDGIHSDPDQMVAASMDHAGDFDKEQIHKEMQERLVRHLAREGKVYPPPKPQASHPVFANDGSFLETFKRLQGQPADAAAEPQRPTATAIVTQQRQFQAAAPPQPMFGKRRGGKILKTGIVAKPKVIDETDTANKNDAWAMYLQEVKKYKSVSCDTDSNTRPLVK